MPDSELDILIRLLAQTQGADAVQAALNKTKEVTADASKSTEDLNEKTKEGTKEGEKFELSHRAIHKILHLIAHESGPAMGTAITGAAAAGTGSIMLLIMAVKELFELFEHLKQKQEEMAAAKAEGWINQQQAIENAATSAENFAKGLEHAKTATGELERQFAQEDAVLAAQIDSHKKLIAAIEGEQLAAANGDKAKEQEIKDRFEDLRREYDATSELLKLESERAQLAKLQKAQAPLSATADVAEKSKEAAEHNQGAAELKSRVENQDEKKLRAAYDEAVERIERSASGPTVEAARAEAEAMKDEDKDVQAFLAYENDKKALEAHKKRVDALTEAADKAVKARDENTQAIEKQSSKVETDEAVSKVHQKTFRDERAIQDVSRLGGEQEIPGLVEAVAGNMEALQHGQKLSAQQIQTNRVLVQLMTDLGYGAKVTFDTINSLAQNQRNILRMHTTLQRQIDDIKHSVAQSGY